MAAKPAYIWDGSAWVQLIAADAINGQGVPTGGTSGQYLKKNSSTDYDTLWADAPVTSLTGTTNQVNVSSSTGAITLSLPQSIGTGSSPSFSSLTLSGDLAVNGGDITSTGSTFNFLSSNVTTLNIGDVATTINLGGGSSTVSMFQTSSSTSTDIDGGKITTYYIGAGDTGTVSSGTAYYAESATTDSTAIRGTFTNASYAGNMSRYNLGRAATTSASFMICFSNWNATQDTEVNIRGNGSILSDVAATTPADYAEYFEWEDGNPDNEDRAGLAVKLINNKIILATENSSDIIGIVSARPAIIGDSAWSHWTDKYLKDNLGREIMEDYQVIQWNNENGDIVAYDADRIPEGTIVPENHWFVTQQRQVLNPNFDPNVEYIPREDRKEWSPVGLLGKLRVFKGQPVNPNWIKMRDIDAQVEEWLVR